MGKRTKIEVNKKNMIDRIGMILLYVAIVVFNIIIGANQKPMPYETLGILMLAGNVVLFIKKVKYKERFLKGKIDIAVSVFMAVMLLPLLFHTYCSYQGTIEFLIKYFFVYEYYLLTRMTVKTEQQKNTMIATTVVSSLIMIIFGLDMLHGNHLAWLVNALNIGYSSTYRFSSTFGYANAGSIYALFCVFLSINRIENRTGKIERILYGLYILLGSYIIYISYSRLILILYVLTILVYFVIKILRKIKISKKQFICIIIGLALLGIVFTIYLGIAMNYSKPCIITDIQKIRRDFTSDQEYTFHFEVSVTSKKEISGEERMPTFQVVETNQYFSEKVLGSEELEEGRNVFEMKITPSQDLYYLKATIQNAKNKEVAIQLFEIDGEEYIFSYRYIPKVIARLFTSFSLKDDSIVLRRQYYENCLRIAKDSPILGHGGNAWKVLYLAYQDYPYIVKESHSYFFEILISYGIVGVSSLLALVGIFMLGQTKEIIKNEKKRKKDLTIFIGLMLMFLYGITFDFSMSFILIILITFMYLALLQVEEETSENSKTKYPFFLQSVDGMMLLIIVTLNIICLGATIAKYCVKDPETKSKMAPFIIEYQVNYFQSSNENNLGKIQKAMMNEPYADQNVLYSFYWNTIYQNIKSFTEESLLKAMDFGIDHFQKVKPVAPMFFSNIAERASIMVRIVSSFQDTNNQNIISRREKVREIIAEEYKQNEIIIKDLKRNGISLDDSQEFIDAYKNSIALVNIKVE